MDEIKESTRRQKVIDGEWSEEESHDKINLLVKEKMD